MTADVLDVVAQDWRPTRVESRQHIRRAIVVVANRNQGLVHISDVRPHLPAWVDTATIGAYISALVRMGVLENTGTYRPNGLHSSRNRTKPAEVRRLVAPIPEVTP